VCYPINHNVRQGISVRTTFDSCSLITSGKFSIGNQPIIDHLAQTDLVMHIPKAVKIEVVDDGLQAGHQDALVIQRQIVRSHQDDASNGFGNRRFAL